MIYLFDKDEKLFKIVNKPAIKTALQKYALTTERYVSDRLTVEMKALNDDELEKVEYMAIQTMEDAHTFHYFYVAQKSSDNLTTLIGVQSGIEELRKSPVFDRRPVNKVARPVIDELLQGTNWRSRFVGETTPHSTNFYYISVFDALKKVCEVWDLEMQFFVEMNGNKIGARYIDFKQKIGQAVGKRVVYGHNALQILQEVERTNIFTALIGRGKGVQVSATGNATVLMTDAGQQANGYGRKLTFEDAVWSTAAGKPVNKPKGQKYLELPTMTKLYGIKNADGSMRPKIGFVDFSEEEDPNRLIERTYTALVDAARPQLTLKTSSVYLKGVSVGDTIRVVRHDKKLDYDTRIFEITFNRLNNQSSDIKLGDRIAGNDKAQAQIAANKAIDDFVDGPFSNFLNNLPNYLPSADGKNTNWYGTEDPTIAYPGKVLINDLWFKPDPEHEGHKILYRWTGEVWEEVLRTYDSESLKAKIAEEMDKVTKQLNDQSAEHDKKVSEIELAATEQDKVVKEQGDSLASVIHTAEGLVSRVKEMQDAQNLVYDPTHYSKFKKRNPATSNLVRTGTGSYDLLRITESGLTAPAWRGFQVPLHSSRFIKGEKLSYRVSLWVDVLPDDIIGIRIANSDAIIAGFDLTVEKTGSNQVFTGTFEVQQTTLVTDDYGLHVWLRKNGVVAFGQLSIIRGDTPPSEFVDSTSAQQVATETVIGQLAGSWAVQNLTSAGTVLNQINLNRDGSIKIDGKLIQITGETYIANGVIKSAMIGNAQVGTAQIGTIDASKANIININAANITSNGLTANVIKGGVLSALNDVTRLDLQTGWLNMNAERVGIRNAFPNQPLQYLVFGQGSINGKSGSYTALMSNSANRVAMDWGSAGIQIWNTLDNTSAVNLYGDIITFMYHAGDEKGININNAKNEIDGLNTIWIRGKSLELILSDIFANFRALTAGGAKPSGKYMHYWDGNR